MQDGAQLDDLEDILGEPETLAAVVSLWTRILVFDTLKDNPVSSGTSRVSRASRGSMTLSFAVR